MTLRRLGAALVPLLALGAFALAPGPVWLYAVRLATVFGLLALLGYLLAAGAHPAVEVLTRQPESGDFVELVASWRAFLPGFWEIEIRDGPISHRHEGWFGVGRQSLRWAEADVRRGVHVYDVALAYRDPLGLMRRVLPHRARLEVSVRPRAVELAANRFSGGGEANLRGLSRTPEHEEFAGVRRYEAGDRVAQLHWPQTVRTGRLQVRETLRSGARVREIVLDTEARDYQDPETFELAVSVAASFALTLARHGQRVGLRAGRVSVPESLGVPQRLLEVLTVIELERRPLRPAGDRKALFVGPPAAALAFKSQSPGAMTVAVGGGPGADLVIADFPALWRLGRRIRP